MRMDLLLVASLVGPVPDLLFMDGGSIVALDAERGVRRTIITGLGFDRPLVVSPDRTQIVYWDHTAGHWDLIVVDSAGKNPRNLTPKIDGGCRSGSYSPDGKRFAFICDKPVGVFLIEGDGEPVQRTDFGFRDAAPAWSPSGKLLAVADFNREEKLIFSVIEAASGETKFTALGRDPDWIDDRHLVFTREHQLWRADITTGATESLGQGDGPVAVLPDGKMVAFTSGREIVVLRVVDGNRRVIAEFGELPRQLVWSPGGEFLAWVDQKVVRVANVTSGEVSSHGSGQDLTLFW